MLSRIMLYLACLVAPSSITLILLQGFGIIHLGETGQTLLGTLLVVGVGFLLIKIRQLSA